LRLSESQLQRIFEDKHYWRQVWLEIVADADPESRQHLKIREATHELGTSSPSRVPQPIADSQIGRASSFPLSEFKRRVRGIGDAAIIKGAEEKTLRSVLRFDGSYEITTITPSRDPKYLKPETRNPVQIQRFDTTSDRRRGPDPADPDAKLLVERWNSGKEPAPPIPRKIQFRNNRQEVRE